MLFTLGCICIICLSVEGAISVSANLKAHCVLHHPKRTFEGNPANLIGLCSVTTDYLNEDHGIKDRDHVLGDRDNGLPDQEDSLDRKNHGIRNRDLVCIKNTMVPRSKTTFMAAQKMVSVAPTKVCKILSMGI
jgi:hypothetical protein